MTELSEDVRALLTGVNYAHVATVLPDGGPHAVPVWIGVEGEQVAFLTGPGSRKARNLERDPRVAISVTAHDNPMAVAIVRGRVARRLEGEEAWTIIDRLAQKYLGMPYPRGEERVVYLVDAEHAQAMKFG